MLTQISTLFQNFKSARLVPPFLTVHHFISCEKALTHINPDSLLTKSTQRSYYQINSSCKVSILKTLYNPQLNNQMPQRRQRSFSPSPSVEWDILKLVGWDYWDSLFKMRWKVLRGPEALNHKQSKIFWRCQRALTRYQVTSLLSSIKWDYWRRPGSFS